MNTANKLTIFRILLVPFFVYFIYQPTLTSRYIAFAIFTVASITDFLDGYIARHYHQITNLGKLLDPVADKILELLNKVASENRTSWEDSYITAGISSDKYFTNLKILFSTAKTWEDFEIKSAELITELHKKPAPFTCAGFTYWHKERQRDRSPMAPPDRQGAAVAVGLAPHASALLPGHR